MKHFCIFILCCMMTSLCYGQEMTLQQCILKGIDKNLSLANARIDIDKGRTTISQNRSRLLPVINGLFQFTDYLKSPVNVTTGVLLGNDFPDNPTWQTIKSMPYNANAGIQVSIPLYNQTLLAAIDVAKTVEKMSSLSYDKAVEDLTVQISKVYYLAQTSQEQGRLTQENIKRMEELCDITEALYTQGVVMEVDLNRVRINLKNLKAQNNQCLTLHGQQLNMLRFLMNMAPEEPLEVSQIVDCIELVQKTAVDGNLPEILLTEQQKVLAEKRIKTVKAGYLPTISLTGYAGALSYQDRFNHFFRTDAAKDNWFGNCYFGVAVKVPLFDANAKKLQIKQYRYEAQQAIHRRALLQQQLDESYANATLQLEHNLEVYRTQTESRQQAENVYRVTEVQYKEGVASMTALLQDEMQLRTAQTACVQALCQCKLAQLDLLKLSGKLTLLSEE